MTNETDEHAPEILPPAQPRRLSYREQAEWIRNLDNQLGILAKVAKNRRTPAKVKVSAVLAAHKIQMDLVRLGIDELSVRFLGEVRELVRAGVPPDIAVERMAETLACLKPQDRDRIIMTTRTLVSSSA